MNYDYIFKEIATALQATLSHHGPRRKLRWISSTILTSRPHGFSGKTTS
jgi:hypothetical protein